MNLKMLAVLLTVTSLATATLQLDLAIADEADDAALRQACSKLDITAVGAALNAGGDPNGVSSDKNPQTPISATLLGLLAAKGPDAEDKGLDVLKLLVAHGAKVGPFDRENFFFPIANGQNRVILYLLERGASPTRKIDGYAPAELAIKYGHPETYDLLVKHGASNVDDRSLKQLVLIGAISNMKPDQVVAAIKNGAAVNSPDPSGLTPLVAALETPIYWPQQTIIIEWLIDKGADVNQESRQQKDRYIESDIPLSQFVDSNTYTLNTEKQETKDLATEVMRYLLKAGAKVSGKDAYGSTPLHESARTNNLAAAKILVEEGAKIKVKDNDGKTPLDYAEDGTMIKFLKSQGATE